MVAGGEPQRGKGIGWYLRAQCIIPRRSVVVVIAGEKCVDGSPGSGGRQFGRGWLSPESAAKGKLKWGLDSWVLERVADEVRTPGTASLERIEVEAEAEWGGRSRGRRAPRGSSSG